MLSLEELKKKSREEKIEALKEKTSDTKIRGLLAFLPAEFPSDRKRLHTAFQKVRMMEENFDFLAEFELAPGALFDYSPLLERVLKRFQGARVLSAKNPDFAYFQVDQKTRQQIMDEIPKSFSQFEVRQLEKIASDLRAELNLH